MDVLTKESGTWEILSWDFSSLGATLFDRIVFMFDFGNTGDGSSGSTFYFDDVDQVATLSAEDFDYGFLRIYPNPVTNNIYLKTTGIKELTKIEIYSILGQKVLEQKKDLRIVNVESLISGIYFLKVYNGKSYSTIKIIKK